MKSDAPAAGGGRRGHRSFRSHSICVNESETQMLKVARRVTIKKDTQ